jgi:hypothetical protein
MHPKIRPIRDGVTFLLLARSKELRLPLFASRRFWREADYRLPACNHQSRYSSRIEFASGSRRDL